jgi:hypothetical protein
MQDILFIPLLQNKLPESFRTITFTYRPFQPKKLPEILQIKKVCVFLTHRNTTRMNFGIYHTDTTIRFRRWNRSRYAAFCSIGKSVTIGMLKRSIADSSLRKAKSEKGLDYTLSNTWAPEYPETTEYDDRALLLQAMSAGDVLFPTSDLKENRIKKSKFISPSKPQYPQPYGYYGSIFLQTWTNLIQSTYGIHTPLPSTRCRHIR